eukprot:PhM_4_TR13571/c0_g1_i1/m.80123/K07300/chaA, CAX; Ca2+:H+ antiporter
MSDGKSKKGRYGTIVSDPTSLTGSASMSLEDGGATHVKNDSLSRIMSSSKLTPEIPSVPMQLFNLVMDSKLNALLLLLPFAMFSEWFSWGDGMVFATNFLVLIPLAAMLGTLTEDLALHSNPSIAALINVTFGNATEMIISIVALRAGAFDVIRYSLMGSVLGNMLLVLGCSFIAAGVKFSSSEYNLHAVNTYGSVLLLSSMSFVIPSTFQIMNGTDGLLALSRELAVCSIFMYAAFLSFQLVTHKHVFDDDDNEGEEEEEYPQFSFVFGVVLMGIVGTIISVCSDYLVESIDGTVHSWSLSRHFIGVILIPIVGNAAEHVAAITQAYKGNLDISFGIAIGSSIQIACFVVPFTVLTAWACGLPLTMNFHPFATCIVFCSVVVLNTLTTTGRCHWLNGVMLLLAYVMLSLAYLHMPDSPPEKMAP